MSRPRWTLWAIIFVLLLVCVARPVVAEPRWQPIPGLSKAGNLRLFAFLGRTARLGGRKVAVFDLDGTLVGQRPNYADGEIFIDLAQRGLLRNRNLPRVPGVSMGNSPPVNLAALQAHDGRLADAWRGRTLDGMNLATVRRRSLLFMLRHYRRKIFRPMVAVARRLEQAGFEVWVVTGATEVFVEPFLAQQLRIPPERVIGIRTRIEGSRITGILDGPITDGPGKVEAIRRFIGVRPLFVAGNSGGDLAMLRRAARLAIVVNPSKNLRVEAQRRGWVVESMPDLVLPDAPHLYRRYGPCPNP